METILADKNSLIRRNAATPYWLLGTIAFIWGLNYAVIRVGLQSLDPILFNFIRFGLSAMAMFVILYYREGSIGINRSDV